MNYKLFLESWLWEWGLILFSKSYIEWAVIPLSYGHFMFESKYIVEASAV